MVPADESVVKRSLEGVLDLLPCLILVTKDLHAIVDAARRVSHDLGTDGALAVFTLYASARAAKHSGLFAETARAEQVMAELARWDGDPATFARSLRNAGVLDEVGELMGWSSNLKVAMKNKREAPRKAAWVRAKRAEKRAEVSTRHHENVDASTRKCRRVDSPPLRGGSKFVSTTSPRPDAKVVEPSLVTLKDPLCTPPPRERIERDRIIPSPKVRTPAASPSLAPLASAVLHHAASRKSGIDPEKMRAKHEQRTAERKQAAAQERQKLTADRERLGVTTDWVPAAGIDEGALCAFEEGAEVEHVHVLEAARAFRRYRELAEGRVHTLASFIPKERARLLAEVAAQEGISCGKILENLHRQAREVVGRTSAPVTLLAPAALDAAAVEARSTAEEKEAVRTKARAAARGAPAVERSRGHAPVGYIDKSRVDEKVLAALKAAGEMQSHSSSGIPITETEWVLSAQANARALARGVLAEDEPSPAAYRAALVAAKAMGIEL